MLLKLLYSLALIPIIYLLIAIVLVYLPFERLSPEKSIDLSTLSGPLQSQLKLLKEAHYTTRNGSKIFYRYISGQRKTVVVLLHGSGSEGRYLAPLAAHLQSSNDISVVIPDLRGHGRSALAKMGDIDYLGQYEHDLEDLIKHLQKEKPETAIFLGGHSSGAGLAIKYAGGKLKPFDGYILLAPYLGHDAPTVKPNSGGWVQVAIKRYIGLSMLNRAGITLLNPLPVLYFNRPEKWNDALQTQSYSYRLNESFSPQDYATQLRNNKKPMLVLVGQADDAFYPEKFAPIFSEYAEQAELHLIEHASHIDLPANEKVFSFISQWLEQEK